MEYNEEARRTTTRFHDLHINEDIGKSSKTSLNNMERNKVEARRAMEIVQLKLSLKNYVGAKKFANMAQILNPELDCLEQVLMMIDVYLSASFKTNGGGEPDWYGVLGVDHLANDETVKKRYKKLALLLHPDKNKFYGAEEAFKLVLEAWSLLSDYSKRTDYDQKWKSKQGYFTERSGMQRKPPKSQEPVFSNKPKYEPNPNPRPNPNHHWSSRKGMEKVIDFTQAYFKKKYS